MAEETTPNEPQAPKENETPLLMKAVVQLDEQGYFTGMTSVDEDPLERGSFQMPPLALDIDPPTLQAGQRARWNKDAEVWAYESEAPTIDQEALRALLLRKIDSSVDAIYAAVVGQRGPEYEMAEVEAKSFLANPEGEAPASVVEWATIKGWTNDQAAHSIVTQAESWRHLSLRVMRPARLSLKEQVRVADNAETLQQLERQWIEHLVTWRAALGLSQLPTKG